MLTEKITWDHSQSNIAKALCISPVRAMEITGSIFFTEIDKTYVAQTLFDNEEDTPAEFKTRTAILDSVIEDLNNINEVIFATFEWTKIAATNVMGEDQDKMKAVLTMLYMVSQQDKNKFIKEFTKRAQDS